MTGHPKFALCRCEHRREQSDRRRLARSVGAEQSHDIARIGREAQVIDGAMWSVGLGESCGFERDAHRAPVVKSSACGRACLDLFTEPQMEKDDNPSCRSGVMLIYVTWSAWAHFTGRDGSGLGMRFGF